MKRLVILGAAVMMAAAMACNNGNTPQNTTTEYVKQQPAWADSANIYEVNVRQYTPEGTFKALEAQLPRLKEQNVDILWLMPIFPISEDGRKGSLGSYYAVKNYTAVNPEFGTLDDLKSLVNKAHQLGMKVILDWVANHTGRDNNWTVEHKDWFNQDSLGNIIMPEGTDWSDVSDLNYDNPEMRQAMIDALKYWIQNADVDGFRCDMAGMVPTDFWVEARKQLDGVKDVFMLAEDDQKQIIDAFDMAYGWKVHHCLNDIAQGKKNADSLKAIFDGLKADFGNVNYLMNFTSNHDENTWNKSEYDRMGNSALQMAVLTYFLPGMPLTYSGQEAANKKALRFFDKDTIDFSQVPLKGFYADLNRIKHQNSALWNCDKAGDFSIISSADNILTFSRKNDKETILCVFNFNAEDKDVELDLDANYNDIFKSDISYNPGKQTIKVLANNYTILLSEQPNN